MYLDFYYNHYFAIILTMIIYYKYNFWLIRILLFLPLLF